MSVDIGQEQGVNAQLRARAEMNLEACNAEIRAIAERARGYQSELLQLSSERVTLQVKRDELVRTLQAAIADREQAILEQDVAMNTPAEQEAAAKVTAIDSLIAATQHDMLMIDVEYGIDEGILRWKQREFNLQEFVKDCNRERDELLKKRAGLEAIQAKAKAAQGKDEKNRLISEFDALVSREQDLHEQLQATADLRRELRALISRRLSDWPLLAVEMEERYGEYTPNAMAQVLTVWKHFMLLVEEHAGELDVQTLRHFMRELPIEEFKRMGGRASYGKVPREKWSYPIANFATSLDQLDAWLSQTEAAERKRQAERRAYRAN